MKEENDLSLDSTSSKTPNMPVAAVYARLTRSPNEEAVDVQVESCLAHARKQGYFVSDNHIFRDEGRDSSITFSTRPGLKRLLDSACIETHPFDIVIVDKNSRFSRKSHEMLRVYSTLSRAGVKVQVAFSRHPCPAMHFVHSALSLTD